MKILLLLLSLLVISATAWGGEKLSLKIVYNNVLYDKDLASGWGMSCFIKGAGRSILFDTGGDAATLLYNMRKMGVSPGDVDVVFLSHYHGDHTGGLTGILKEKGNVAVYLPASFPEGFKAGIKERGAACIPVSEAEHLFDNVHSTGEMSAPGSRLKEQSLIIETPKGLIIVTGCAHPGIASIVRKAAELLEKKVHLVLGGFHLRGYRDEETRSVIKELKEIGVEKVGPSHCTGDRPIRLFREAWGDDFLDLGCGAVYESDLGE